MTELIFLDTETTGLDPELHEVWELAYATDDTDIQAFQLTHTLRGADMKALELNGYYDRYFPHLVLTPDRELQLREAFRNQTIVVANPTFDRMMLRKRWGLEPWHYRSIDIESFAMPILGWDRPQGMKNIRDELIKRGYGVIAPDHSARKDVQALRTCYHDLIDIQRKYIHGYNEWTKLPDRVSGESKE